jgi:hypothetical protein
LAQFDVAEPCERTLRDKDLTTVSRYGIVIP